MLEKSPYQARAPGGGKVEINRFQRP